MNSHPSGAASGPGSAPSGTSGQQDEKTRARARVGMTIKNKWRLDDLLGVGGMASVYAATHRNGSRAALKILHTEFALDAGIRDRFLREGYVANRIDHRGRVAILDDDATELDEPFLVMELLEGETVQQLWKRKHRKVSVVRSLRIADEVLDTLTHFHREGIVHRDLKPANIFITRENVVKLLDFGVARMREAGGEMTRAGTALGTPSYMAPEQAMGLTEGIDGRADIFSVGATLYALMSGQRLHQGRSDNEAFILAATQPAPSLARAAPELPVEVIALVDKALAWDARNRFESAAVMREEVQRLLAIYDKKGTAQRERQQSGPDDGEPGDARRRAGQEQADEVVELIEEAVEEPDVDENDPAVQRLVDLFRRLERLLPTVRQYGWEHPEADHKLRASFQGVIEALRADPEHVSWTIKPYSFMHRGQTIWEPTAPFDAIPYHLFAAGVRTMKFVPGVNEDELKDLCRLFLIDPVRDLTPEDDVATALWEKRLEHLKYDVINVFAEGDAADREHFYDEADNLEALARRAADERSNRAEAAAMAVSTDQAALVAARKAAAVLALDPIAKKAIGAQLAMSADRWSERFIDVLVEAFFDAKKRGDLDLVAEPLDASVRDLAFAKNFELIFGMHEALLKAVEALAPQGGKGARSSASLRGDLTRAMFLRDTAVLIVREGVRPVLIVPGAPPQKAPDLDMISRGLVPVLAEIGADSLDPMMDLVGQIQHEGLRAAIFAYIQRVMPGNEEKIVDRVMAIDVEVARPMMKMLSGIRTQGALDALTRLAGSTSPALRCEATALLATSPEQLRDSLSALAESQEEPMRFAALRTMAHHQVRAAGPLLVRKVQDVSFHQLSVDERRELLRALHVLHTPRAESLAIEIVQKHGIMPDEALDQTRAIAAELLGRESKSMEALEAVLSATKRRWWNSPPVRDAAAAAAGAIAARLGKRVTATGEIQ